MYPEHYNYERASWHSDQAVRRLAEADKVLSPEKYNKPANQYFLVMPK